VEKIVTHLAVLDKMDWSAFQAFPVKKQMKALSTELSSLKDVMIKHKNELQQRHSNGSIEGRISSENLRCIRQSEVSMELGDGDSMALIEAKFVSPKKPPGRVSSRVKRRKSALEALRLRLLKIQDYYVPVILKDEDCGVADYNGASPATPAERAQDRYYFRQALAVTSLLRMPVVLFVRTSGGQHPALLVVFKVPLKHYRENNHAFRVSQAIQQCQTSLPTFLAQQDLKRINSILCNSLGITSILATTIRKYITGDSNESHHDGGRMAAVLELFENVDDGTITESLLLDHRQLCSRGQQGGGSTSFQMYWDKCYEILHNHDGSAAHERRTALPSAPEAALYCSAVHSISNLVDLATQALRQDVKDGKIVSMPLIPSDESVRLQFCPNDDMANKNAKATGRLGVIRKVQSRSLRHKHVDQHWVCALTRTHKEWLIAVKLQAVAHDYQALSVVRFAGQDDKCKVPVGDVVHVSSNVRPNTKAIVPTGESVKAADHDWKCANIIPSVLHLGNIPDDMSGSFFGGGHDTGTGELEVVLKDATFDASDVFSHCAQLLVSMRERQVPFLLLLQTDGGPDHNLMFVRTQLALVAMFLELEEIDHLVVLRGCPQGSYLNTVERGMSILNLGLQHCSIKRGRMPNWAEKRVQSASTMKEIRVAANKFDREKATATAPSEMVPSTLVGRIGDSPEEVLRNEEIGANVRSEQSRRADQFQHSSLRVEWGKAMQYPIGAIGERFKQLKLQGRPVLVKDRVSDEFVELLHSKLLSVDDNYSKEIRLTTQWKDIPKMRDFFDSHVVLTPYSMSIRKCGGDDCQICSAIRSPEALQELIFQRQPTPKADTGRPGHFLRRDDALAKFSREGSPAATLCDVSELPSKKGTEETSRLKQLQALDSLRAVDYRLNKWSATKVRATVRCWQCGMPRLIYSNADLTKDNKIALRRRIEGMHFVCGALLFQEDEPPLGRIISQKLALNCETGLERAYYNPKQGRKNFTTPLICIHCASQSNLRSHAELHEEGLTDGKECYPVCSNCIIEGKKPVARTGAKKRMSQSRKEDNERNQRSRRDLA
jgi:hypothetical protein